MVDKYEIAKRLKEKRTQLNISVEKVAEMVGCSAGTIWAYERGTRAPKKDKMYKLAILYNTSIDELFF